MANKIDTVEKRQSPRKVIAYSAIIRDGEKSITCTSVDISANSLRVAFDSRSIAEGRALETGQYTDVEICDSIFVPAVVVRIGKAGAAMKLELTESEATQIARLLKPH